SGDRHSPARQISARLYNPTYRLRQRLPLQLARCWLHPQPTKFGTSQMTYNPVIGSGTRHIRTSLAPTRPTTKSLPELSESDRKLLNQIKQKNYERGMLADRLLATFEELQDRDSQKA